VPAIETDDLYEFAVLWKIYRRGNDAEPRVLAPVQISAKWLLGEKEAVDKHGQTIQSSGDVVVDQDIPVGSIMWEGELKDVPDAPSNLHQVIGFKRRTDIKGKETRRRVTLTRYADEYPGT
jgi:hypothetical protein